MAATKHHLLAQAQVAGAFHEIALGLRPEAPDVGVEVAAEDLVDIGLEEVVLAPEPVNRERGRELVLLLLDLALRKLRCR